MVCKEGHNLYDNPVCKKKWLDYKSHLGDEASKFHSQGKPPGDDPGSRPANLTGASYWSNPPRPLNTMITIGMSSGLSNSENKNDAIIDGGATGTVIGIHEYHALCDELNIEPQVSKLGHEDPSWHAFGIDGNTSRSEKVVGKVTILVPCGKGRYAELTVYVIDGNVPFIIAKPTLIALQSIEDHAQNFMEISLHNDERVRLNTYIGADGHSRLPLSRENMEMNISEGLLQSMVTSLPEHHVFNISDGKKLIDDIHSKTHLHPTSLKILLERNHKWKPQLWNYAHEVLDNCPICIRVGDPRPSRKISFTRLHTGFNDHVFSDIVYWTHGTKQYMILNCVDLSISYSKLGLLRHRSIPHILSVFERIWIHANGKSMNVVMGSEFHKEVVSTWFSKRDIKLSPIPARRHNKVGVVERKNRVVKDVLERLDSDPNYDGYSFESRLSLTEFISNVMYGNQVASSFEMARGFTPGIGGLAPQPIPNTIRVAYEETQARRLLKRIMKSRPAQKSSQNMYEEGERVLVLIPGGPRKRGKWMETKVEKVTPDGHIECGTGRNRKFIAHEDVRKIPITVLARNIQRAELKMESLQLADDSDFETHSSENADSSRNVIKRITFGEDRTSSDDDFIANQAEQKQNGSDLKSRESIAHEPEEYPSSGREQGSDEHWVTPEQSVESDRIEETTGRDNGTYVPSEYIQEQSESEDQPHVEPDVRRSTRQSRHPDRFTPATSLGNPLDRHEARQKILRKFYDRMGTTQFMKHEAPDIQQWIFAELHAAELQQNWNSNKIDVPCKVIPQDANVRGSHIVYVVKPTEDPEVLKLKSRICVHGNRDDEKESLRTDSAVASHTAFRLIYSLVMTFRMVLANVDIQGAYTQSGKAHRKVYVKPPWELEVWNILWLLTVTMYGLATAGRKWQRASDAVMIACLGLSMIAGYHQLFHHRDSLGMLYIAKYVDDLLIASADESWHNWAVGGINTAFKIGSSSKAPETIVMNSTEINVSNETLVLHMRNFQRTDVDLFRISPPRRKQVDDILSATEIREVRRIAGKLGYLGTGVSPFAALAASFLQQSIPSITVAGLKASNGIITEVMRRTSFISYIQPTNAERKHARIVCFSDAGFCHPKDKKRAQEGCIFGIAFGARKGSVFRTIRFISRTQRRLSQSSAAAETIAALISFGYAANLQRAYQKLTGICLPFTLLLESKSLHTSSATERDPRDPSSIADVAVLREAYLSGEIDGIAWVPGTQNPAGPLTKPHAGKTADILEKLLTEGRLQVDVDDMRHYGPALGEEL